LIVAGVVVILCNNKEKEKEYLLSVGMSNQEIDKSEEHSLQEILKELHLLKKIAIDMNQYLNIQNEELSSLKNTIQNIEQKVDSANDDIEIIKQMEIDNARVNYFKEYILPAGIISLNYPIFWLFGPKGGVVSSLISLFLLK
jgi:hypothetical protein